MNQQKKEKPRCFTDYPIYEWEAGKLAPIREVEFISYDGNKYCKVLVNFEIVEIKSGYLYLEPKRFGENAKKYPVKELSTDE